MPSEEGAGSGVRAGVPLVKASQGGAETVAGEHRHGHLLRSDELETGLKVVLSRGRSTHWPGRYRDLFVCPGSDWVSTRFEDCGFGYKVSEAAIYSSAAPIHLTNENVGHIEN